MTACPFSREELEEAFGYLDLLRESGATNMFGARPYLMRDLEHSESDASKLLSLWMTSDLGSTPDQRAAAILDEPDKHPQPAGDA